MFLCPTVRDFKETEYSESDIFPLETKALKLPGNRGVRRLSEIF